MKRLKIIKSYMVLWLFIYFMIQSNLDNIIVFFNASLAFNLAVLTLLIIGIIVIMKSTINLVMLAGTFGTLAYKKQNLSFYLQGIDKIMPANIAHMFHSRAEKGVLLFTAEESRAVIEWIEEKFAHQSRYINYFTGTVLMIGLLGTFSGLLVSIDEMGRIILSLTGDIDLGEVIRSFSGPLGGMAVGFGSSLFGVVAAIIMGVMGYILNKNQEILIEGVEDWLKGRIIDTPTASASPAVGLDGGVTEELPEHRSSFMDVFIDTIGALTQEMKNISQTNERLHSITIASVQASRDEHEQSIEMYEKINHNLEVLRSTNEHTAQQLEEKFSTLLHEISKKLDMENESLQMLEKLGKVNIIDLRKNIQFLSELKEQIEKEVKNQELSHQEIAKHTRFLESIAEDSHTSLETLRQLSLGTTDTQAHTQQASKSGLFSKLFG